MIPSLLQIPSAVSDSKLHSVLPNNGKGDFTFDRSTGATRINKDGLIEEVGYFSSELVQNGNFSELGSDVVLNGNFDNGSTSWTLIGDVSIGNGVCTFFDTGSNTNSRLVQVTITANKTYKVVFSVTRYVAGRVQLIFGGASAVNVDISAGVGTYTAYVTAGGSTQWEIKRDGSYPNFDFDIDNVSVKQVDPNDRWTLGTGWSYGENKVVKATSAGSGVYCQQDFSTLVNGSLYKIQFDLNITSATTTTIGISNSGAFGNLTAAQRFYTTSGTKKIVGTYDSSYPTFIRFVGGANTGYEITNISIVEVQGDRPRLSYDITNGVVEDKPHLLLEPSSTNLLTFSEDFSQWENIRTTDALSSISSPSNTTNVYKIIPSVDNNNHRIDKQLTLTNGNTYSLSFFAKKGEYNCIQAAIGQSTVINNFVSFNLNTGVKTESGTIANSSMTLLPNGWYRCSLTAAAGTIDRVVMGIGNNDVYSFVGDASSGLYLWGAMIEEKAFSTSYIPTAGTTITRAAETCNNSKPSVNSTEGVLYCEIAALADDLSFRTISVSDGTTSNRSVLRYGGTSNFINVLASSGGSNVFDNNFTLSEITDFNKIAIKYKVNDYALWVNGNEVKTDTSGAAPVGLSQVQFSNAVGNSNIFYGKVKGVAVYNEALTDAQLIQLTS